MTKEPTATIYNCLEQSFWTKKKCFRCQKFFTTTDYQNKNYQLSFLEVLKVEQSERPQYCLEVVVQLAHQQCSLFKKYPNECQIQIVKNII